MQERKNQMLDQVNDKLEQARRVQEFNQAIAEMESGSMAGDEVPATDGEIIPPTEEVAQGDFGILPPFESGSIPEFESGAGPKASGPLEISIGSVANTVWMTLSGPVEKLVLTPADALGMANRLREAANRITHRQHVERAKARRRK